MTVNTTTAPRRLRVLQLLTHDEPAGTELMTFSLVKNFDRGVFDIDVAIFTKRATLTGFYEQCGIQVYELNGHRSLLTALRRLRSLLRSKQYDVVHVYGFRASIVARFVRLLCARETAILDGIQGRSVGATWEKGDLKSEVSLRIGRLLSPWVDYHVANSRTAMEFLTGYGRFPAKKFVVIQNGLDADFWQPANNSTPGNQIVCVALFRPGKRQEDLVLAAQKLKQRGINFECLFAGEGPTESSVRQLAEQTGLSDSVRFLGRLDRPAVRDLLRESDIFVLPSAAEGLPGSVMEAMASGLPVVATDIGGTRELITEGETGFLVPPRRPDLISERIEILLRDPDMRTTMGRRGRERIERDYSLKRMIEQMAQFYITVANSHGGYRKLRQSGEF